MRAAIPLSIDLKLRDASDLVPASLLLDRLTQALAHVEVDRGRGRVEVLKWRDELLAKGTPEILVNGLLSQAEHTSAVTIRWDEWPDNQVEGHITNVNPALDRPAFDLAFQDSAFAKYAAIELGKALSATARLTSTFNCAIETEFYPKETEPINWIQQYFAELDSSGAHYDPITQTFAPFSKRYPRLRELNPWQDYMQAAIVAFLEQNRKVNSEAMTEGFATYVEYARQYVKELCEFELLQHCWSVDIDESHHNQAFVEYSDWFALIRFSGVPSGLLKERTIGPNVSGFP